MKVSPRIVGVKLNVSVRLAKVNHNCNYFDVGRTDLNAAEAYFITTKTQSSSLSILNFLSFT